MNQKDDLSSSISIAKQIASDLVEFAEIQEQSVAQATGAEEPKNLPPGDQFLVEYDDRISDVNLRAATRSRFASAHYADAVEAGVKALNECVRERTGRSEDGDALMTAAFFTK
jgi:hypothetical protein